MTVRLVGRAVMQDEEGMYAASTVGFTDCSQQALFMGIALFLWLRWVDRQFHLLGPHLLAWIYLLLV